jgi:chaperonin GroEL
VVFQPQTYEAFQRGINLLADTIRPTLGPIPRFVGFERPDRSQSAELLDNGALIARRIVELTDRDASMGALLFRQSLWHLYEKAGDGTATAAVLFQEIFNRGIHYVVAGGNAARLRVYLQRGLRVILDELARMTEPLQGQVGLTRIAEAISLDHDLAAALGELMDIVGPYGQVDIRTGYGLSLKREYVEGAYWQGGLFSPELFTRAGEIRAELVEPRILITDFVIEDARTLIPVLECVARADSHALIILANKLSEQALGLLRAVNENSEYLRVIGVKTPELSTHVRAEILPDMACLLGGRPYVQETGESLERIQADDFGQARRAWADRENFGFVGGHGDLARVRLLNEQLQAAYHAAEKLDARERILQRLGKFIGGSGTCWIGGLSKTETETRQHTAERIIAALRGALLDGMVPGGGAALLACQPALRCHAQAAEDDDERAAYEILYKAMETPTRALVANAGYDPHSTLGIMRQAGPGCAFDVLQGRAVNAISDGLVDSATVVREAVTSAVSTAALALSIDVLVHHRKIKLSLDP